MVWKWYSGGDEEAPRERRFFVERGLMEHALECLRCKSRMVAGLVIDMKSLIPSRWIEGNPERNWLGLKLKNKPMVEIKTYRCPKCGYLESNAPD
jgi:hypothetical protein